MRRGRSLALIAAAATFSPRPLRAADGSATIRVGNVASDTYAEPFYFAAAGMAQKIRYNARGHDVHE
jgi:hypothetical protein